MQYDIWNQASTDAQKGLFVGAFQEIFYKPVITCLDNCRDLITPEIRFYLDLNHEGTLLQPPPLHYKTAALLFKAGYLWTRSNFSVTQS